MRSFTLKNLHFIDLMICLPSVFFIFLTNRFWGQAPPLDYMVYFRQLTQFYMYGPNVTIEFNGLLHPPFLFILQSIFFKFFGISPQTYTLLGYICFVISSSFFYFFIRSFFSRRLALFSMLLLFLNPNILINFFYPNPDSILFAVFLFTFYAHMRNKKILLSLMYILLYLTKETGMIIAVAILIYRIFSQISSKKGVIFNLRKIINEVIIFLPTLLAFVAWSNLTAGLGLDWKETWLHEETRETSYVLFAIKKILSFKFLNSYLLQNIFNIFAFNFQWLYTSFFFVLWYIYFHKIQFNSLQKKFVYSLIFISLSYLCVALSFPTWTIPRYGILMLVSLFFLLSMYIDRIDNIFVRSSLFMFILLITIVSNIASIDPLSSKLGRLDSSEDLYDNQINSNGPDGQAYNLQIVRSATEQNKLIEYAYKNNIDYLATNCDENKLGERLYSINLDPVFYPQFEFTKSLNCISRDDALFYFYSGELQGKSIYIKDDIGDWNTYSF